MYWVPAETDHLLLRSVHFHTVFSGFVTPTSNLKYIFQTMCCRLHTCTKGKASLDRLHAPKNLRPCGTPPFGIVAILIFRASKSNANTRTFICLGFAVFILSFHKYCGYTTTMWQSRDMYMFQTGIFNDGTSIIRHRYLRVGVTLLKRLPSTLQYALVK